MITTKNNDAKNEMQFVVLDRLVPEDHLVRKIDRVIDFDFIRDKVRHLYSEDNGRPSIDPVVLFKIVFLQFVFGIKSMRQTIKEIEVNVAYRWFLGYNLTDEIPHYSTFGKNYKRRFEGTTIFEDIFQEILGSVMQKGLISEDTIFVDSTHIKAYANKRKAVNEYVKESSNHYIEALNEELNEIRKQEGKGPINKGELRKIAVSKTDPECGMFHKGEKEKQFAYSVQTACDENGWIVGCKTNPGNVSDNIGGTEFIVPMMEQNEAIKYVVMDAGYTSPILLNQIIINNRIPVIPYTSPKGGNHKEISKFHFTYYQEGNYYECPAHKILAYKGLNSDGYLLYKSSKKDCNHCPLRDQCINKTGTRTLTRHLLEYTKDVTREIRLSDVGKEKYALRKMTIERVFADCKSNFRLGYTLVKGLKKNHERCLLLFAMANLKKLALYEWNHHRESTCFTDFFFNLLQKKLSFSF